jgi:hypothetical protein
MAKQGPLLIGLCMLASLAWSQDNIQLNYDPSVETLVRRFVEVNQSRDHVAGWRIQILSTTDRMKVESTLQEFRYRFPYIPADWSHDKPYYKLQAGAFAHKLDAIRLLHLIQKDYPGAYLAKDQKIRPQEFLNDY